MERAVKDLSELTSRLTKKLEHVNKVNKEELYKGASQSEGRSGISRNRNRSARLPDE